MNFLQNLKKFLLNRPNLLSSLPVEILERVFASTFGFNLIPMEVTLFIFFDILFINNASLSDSTLISKTLFLIAKRNSLLVFPTPEKTIFFGINPSF